MGNAVNPKAEKIKVPIAALVAVQKMFKQEGLDGLAEKISQVDQVNLDAALAKAASKGIDISGVDTGSLSFKDSLRTAERMSTTGPLDGLFETKEATVEVQRSLLEELQMSLRARPDLLAKSKVAKAVTDCDPSDRFNCPRDWPSLMNAG